MDAKAAMASADKAARAKDWAKAQADYAAAYRAAPSAQALNGLAGASYELKSWGEAYEQYDEFLKTYPDAMGKTVRGQAEKRLKELEAKTGALTITVNESGAAVSVDDKPMGQSPVRALLRVAIGPHRVHVAKPGFAAFDKTVDVAAGAKVPVDANLTRESKTGKLVVKEISGQQVRVVIDNVDMGPAPWEGEVAPGSHEVRVRGANVGSTVQRVEIEAGKAAEVVMTASSAMGHLDVSTSDGMGNIYVDGKLVGEGHYAADLPSGTHDIHVTREGFVAYDKRVELADRQSLSETVTLRTAGQSLQGVKVEEDRPFYGTYGGFGLLGAVELGGMGNSLDSSDQSCKTLGAKSCDTPGPMGGGVFGYFGFTWLPVGVELFLGGLFDATTQKAEFAAPDLANRAVLGPARTEEFTFLRFGGVAAIRARATLDGRTIRASFAVGPGIAYKQMAMQRKTSTPDGYAERYVPEDGKANQEGVANNLSYTSPALTGDLAVHWRFGQTTALSVGVLAWIESAGNQVVAQSDRQRFLVSEATGAQPLHIPTPRYELASGAQFFLGPYLGLMFGP